MDSVTEDYYSESEKRSLLVSVTETVSSLSESKGMIVENPDGTYSHAVLAAKAKDEEVQCQGNSQFAGYPRNRILYVVDDDEIALYSGFYDLPTRVDEFLDLLIRHQRYFIIFLLVCLSLEGLYCALAYTHAEEAVKVLMNTYRSEAHDGLLQVYYTAIVAEVCFIAIYFPLGLLAACKRSVRLLNWFGTLSLIGLIFQMILAYANRFEITTFLMRFVGLVYSRFLSQLVVSLLLLPR